jgi:hypothetical protein
LEPRGKLASTADAELHVDVLQMIVDSPSGDKEPLGNLSAGETVYGE